VDLILDDFEKKRNLGKKVTDDEWYWKTKDHHDKIHDTVIY